jgi:hypothetical protein
MKKLAFFVEGYSEVIFVEKLIEEIAGRNKVKIERGYVKGGKSVPKELTVLTGKNAKSSCEYYVLILNCQGDQQVATRISEEHPGFSNMGYERIIGIRDVRPTFQYSDIPRLVTTLKKGIDPSLIPAEIILSVMEIESLFLGEVTHFEKIDPAITLDEIKNRLGFDPVNEDMERRTEPAADLANCYAIAGKTYTKYVVQTTIDALDFDRIYLEQPQRFQSLSRLVSHIDSFLSPPALQVV